MIKFIILSGTILFCVYLTEQVHFLQPEYINKINNEAITWQAGQNFHPDTPLEYFKRLLGSRGVGGPKENDPVKSHDPKYSSCHHIPKEFDARKKWKQCKSIGTIRDQGNCVSGWALSTTSAFSDRLCIATNYEFNEMLSAEELIYCCKDCGFTCFIGRPIKAWEHFKWHGIVTGGAYNSSEGCQPYQIAPCLHDKPPEIEGSCMSKPIEDDHICRRECFGDTKIDYKEDHRYTRDYYYLEPETIQKDILTYGPIEASFHVYDDFLSYKTGVYIKSENATFIDGHAAKLIGWGVENDVPYWLLLNSWNTNWGDNGSFKIRRGTNECGIDNSTTAGVPYVDDYFYETTL
ncbi:cathepsin B-like [Daktulosphaira vitifoliae]|uniref:cathepsin B-like n=1 Tax=Daktulosphaira vitifoliae TaxID=58002 RepID=UPI0021AAE591|nr:cathepsin B-like [Daktulosphaira vitifoliae]